MLLQRAHQQQQAALRRYQEKVAKMKGLEETVRQQEKVNWGAQGWGEKGRLGDTRPSGPSHPSVSTTWSQDHGGWGDVMVTTALH